MKRVYIVIALLALTFVGIVALSVVSVSLVPSEHVYTVLEVQQGRTQRPKAWASRTILISGLLVHGGTGCLSAPCGWEGIAPLSVGGARHQEELVQPLVVVHASRDTSRAPSSPSTFLRNIVLDLPVIGHLLPVSHVYRVHLLPIRHCATPSLAALCPDAILLNPLS